jgi:type 1 glutamine amidotransferase
LILSGQGDHDWRATTPFLRKMLTDTGRFDVRVCEIPDGVTDRTLAGFDVLVDHSGASALESDTEKVIAGFVESGKGLVITHGALGSSIGVHRPDGDRPESARTVPGYWPVLPSHASHGLVRFLDVKIDRPEHPIAQGIPTGFRTADASYAGMESQPAAEVIARTLDQPVLLAYGYGKGRVLCSALGHDLAAMQQPEFIATFARGTEWAATGAVTLPADLGRSRPNPDAVRGLVITGGHDHETSFLLALRRVQGPGRDASGSECHGLSERPERQVRCRDHVRFLPGPG